MGRRRRAKPPVHELFSVNQVLVHARQLPLRCVRMAVDLPHSAAPVDAEAARAEPVPARVREENERRFDSTAVRDRLLAGRR